MQSFGETWRQSGLRVNEFCQKAGISSAALNRARNGENVSSTTADKIAAAMGKKRDDIFPPEKIAEVGRRRHAQPAKQTTQSVCKGCSMEIPVASGTQCPDCD